MLSFLIIHFFSSSSRAGTFKHACNEETKDRRRSIAFMEVSDRDTVSVWSRNINEIERVRFEDIL